VTVGIVVSVTVLRPQAVDARQPHGEGERLQAHSEQGEASCERAASEPAYSEAL
jgi:hypothetical protein